MSSFKEPEAYLRSGSNELKILEYGIGKLHMGINILKVSRILDRPAKLARPGATAHESVIGLFEDHGAIVPLVDLGVILGLDSDNSKGRVIITEFFDEITGLLVDRVEQVHTISWEQVVGAEDILWSLDNPYVIAVARPSEDHNILLVDYEKIVLELAPSLKERRRQDKESDADGIDIGKEHDASLSGDAASAWHAQGQTILVAEDSTPVRQMLTFELEEINFKVIEAKDGQRAVELFDEHDEIDMVIADVEMPRKDGLALLGHIRQHPSRKGTPVLIYSSIGDIGMKERAKVMKANGHITKLEIETLLEEIRKIFT
ncbi:MAG: chemotaxis protein CheV [Desulfamplus sp.]|nr:chemotaxis protein CheV [Desulfamplus sp.]